MVGVYGVMVPGNDTLLNALAWGCVAAAATSLGTLPVVLSFRFSQRAHDAMLGFGAGVMLAASSFSLVIPALQVAQDQGAGSWGSSSIVGAGILLGAGLLLWIDKAVPHEHFIKGVEGGGARKLKRVWMFVLAICLHNFPEGLSIGVGFAGPDMIGGQALATGISIQDIPEGLVVALALTGVGYSRGMAVGVAVLSGLIEPLAAIVGVVVIGLSATLLPWGLAMAAGAMLFVISHEIIPESHRQGHETAATIGLMAGFVLMMLLDTALG
ncbi:ZIP family metal transporter [Allopusillimonas ginsengisoli]|uniref:ZIP family metal transporter n=1 Tax=Allopusillimonas ginsengisoli TaxID=453575 RepID=UPI001FD672E7|nr:ZIP family metal transporter [Allopusillimonas ginsengisoli]